MSGKILTWVIANWNIYPLYVGFESSPIDTTAV